MRLKLLITICALAMVSGCVAVGNDNNRRASGSAGSSSAQGEKGIPQRKAERQQRRQENRVNRRIDRETDKAADKAVDGFLDGLFD